MAKWPKLKWEKEPQGPLKGVKIVDMSTVVLGPFATLNFGDMGADVIKVENGAGKFPGDMMRRAGDSPTGDLGPIFTALNRNKKSIDLDAKTEDGKALLTALLEDADIFFHNVRMAGMDRLGFGYEDVKKINPGIVYVHCAGFGEDGEYAERQAYDDLIQAVSGFAALSEKRDGGAPSYAPSLVADKTVGLFATNATLAALFHKERSGEGQFVQIPMFESFTWFNMVENLWGETFVPGNGRLAYTRSVNPRRKPYPTKDGYIALVPYNDQQWKTFFALGDRPGVFDDPRFRTYQERTKNIGALYGIIEEVAVTKPTDEWLVLLNEANIPAMKYNRMEDVMTDPHLTQVGFFQERDRGEKIGKYRAMKHPVKYGNTPVSIHADPPQFDADGDDIRAALGFAPKAKGD